MGDKRETAKIALIGCGNIAHVHMRFIKKAGFTVDAVCDASPIRVDLFADKYNIVKRYTSIDELLSHERPEIVHILTPPHTHYSIAMKALKSGSNVLVEKPLCQEIQEYQELSRIADEKGLLLSVDHTQVYNPMIVQARTRCQSGELGRIVRMEYAYDNPSLIKSVTSRDEYRWAKGTPTWFSQVKGGAVIDLLPHPLSILLSFDQELCLSHVQARTLPGGIIEELTVMLQSERMDAIINLSLNQRPLKNNLSIYGERGSIRIDLRGLFSVYLPERRLPGIVSRIVVALSESLQILSGFTINVLKLLSGKAHTYDGLAGIIENFHESVATGKRGDLPMINAGRVTALTEDIIEASLSQNMADNVADDVKLHPHAGRISQPADYLITGGTGFIGRAITNCLVGHGKSTRVLCRLSSNIERLPQDVGLAFGDLRNLAAVSQSLAGVKTVIHCAAAISGDWAEYFESTVMGTQNVLTALEKSPVERLIYISSLGVLDFNRLKNGSKVDESSPIEPMPADRGFYTRAKVEAEELVAQFAARNPGIKVIILRPGLVYGSETNNNIQNCGLLLDKYLLVFGLGKRRLGLNYVENLAQAVALAGEADLASGSIIQIVDPEQPTVRKIIEEHNKLSEYKVVPIYIPVAVWKLLFLTVDALLLLKSKKAGTFRYRFASNANILNYCSDFAQKTLGRFAKYDFTESFSRTYLNR